MNRTVPSLLGGSLELSLSVPLMITKSHRHMIQRYTLTGIQVGFTIEKGGKMCKLYVFK